MCVIYPGLEQARVRNLSKTRNAVLEALGVDSRSRVCEANSGDLFGGDDSLAAGYYGVEPYKQGEILLCKSLIIKSSIAICLMPLTSMLYSQSSIPLL